MHNSYDAVRLEQMVDCHGLHTVVEMLAGICHEKADHIACCYGSSGDAMRWDGAGARLGAQIAPIRRMVG